MSQADAEEIAHWRYPDEYSLYDWTSDPCDLAELLDPVARADQYFAVKTSSGSLIGFPPVQHPTARALKSDSDSIPLGRDGASARASSRGAWTSPAAASHRTSSGSRSRASTAGRSPSTSAPASPPSAPTSTGRMVPSGSSSRCSDLPEKLRSGTVILGGSVCLGCGMRKFGSSEHLSSTTTWGSITSLLR
jgi:hypothetical protein